MTRLAILFSFALALCACGSGTDVRFQNLSEYPLEAVELSGSGFRASLGLPRLVDHLRLRSIHQENQAWP